MRIGLWALGTEILAVDLGPSQAVDEDESEIGAGTGGQFEMGFAALPADTIEARSC